MSHVSVCPVWDYDRAILRITNVGKSEVKVKECVVEGADTGGRGAWVNVFDPTIAAGDSREIEITKAVEAAISSATLTPKGVRVRLMFENAEDNLEPVFVAYCGSNGKLAEFGAQTAPIG